MKNIKWTFIALLIFATPSLFAQLTLEEAYNKATENYPLIKQYKLIEKSKQFNLSNATRAYLPQVSITGRATYQTEVIEFPIEIPKEIMDFKALPKDQYLASIEVSQLIWDGGAVAAQKKAQKSSSLVETKQTEVDLFAIKERINQIFFGILQLEEQLRLNQTYQAELDRNYTKISNYITNGIANAGDLDQIEVEQLTNKQQCATITSARNAYLTMLSAWVGESITQIAEPAVPIINTETNNRPELLLFDAMQQQISSKKSAINAQNYPQIGAFIQGSYGNPGLNFLLNEFKPYAIGGIKFSWNIGSFYQRKNNLSLLNNEMQKIAIQRDVFLFNNQLNNKKIAGDIAKLEAQIKEDDRIITLRNRIKVAAEAKVANGVLSVTDMLREVTAENNALQNRSLHKLELLMTLYNLKISTNN